MFPIGAVRARGGIQDAGARRDGWHVQDAQWAAQRHAAASDQGRQAGLNKQVSHKQTLSFDVFTRVLILRDDL